MVKKHEKPVSKRLSTTSRVSEKSAGARNNLPSERRKYDRYETALKIQFYVNFDLETKIDFRIKEKNSKDFSVETYEALSKNVSVEGICFSSARKLTKGDMLLLDVYLPSAVNSIKMQGEVRWSRPAEDKNAKGMYDTGIKLSTVNSEPVEKTIFIDDVHQIAWSIVLESIFGNFKHLASRRKKIN